MQKKKKGLWRPVKSACGAAVSPAVSPPTAGLCSSGAGHNAACSAFNYSCYWMINLATQLNMEPITVPGGQRVHVCVSPWSKFAAFSCRANARVHTSVIHCKFSDFDCVSALSNIVWSPADSWDDLDYSVTLFIPRTVNIWQRALLTAWKALGPDWNINTAS